MIAVASVGSAEAQLVCAQYKPAMITTTEPSGLSKYGSDRRSGPPPNTE